MPRITSMRSTLQTVVHQVRCTHPRLTWTGVDLLERLGVVRFVDELVANLRRAGAARGATVRADSGFWSHKLIDRLDAHDVKWSITVALGSAVRAAIQAIGDNA